MRTLQQPIIDYTLPAIAVLWIEIEMFDNGGLSQLAS